MKKTICIFCIILFPILSCCAGSDIKPPGIATEDGTQNTFTEDELLLQRAFHDLQDEERLIYSWDQGEIVDSAFVSESSREIIGPDGILDIQGKKLTQVRYGFQNLYYDNGTFIGTDHGTPAKGSIDTPWKGGLGCWFWLDKQELHPGEELTYTLVIRNCSEQGLSFGIGDLGLDLYRDGELLAGGRTYDLTEIVLQPGEIHRIVRTDDAGSMEAHNILEPGIYKVQARIDFYFFHDEDHQRTPRRYLKTYFTAHTEFVFTEDSPND